jgi:hypothetical protein
MFTTSTRAVVFTLDITTRLQTLAHQPTRAFFSAPHCCAAQAGAGKASAADAMSEIMGKVDEELDDGDEIVRSGRAEDGGALHASLNIDEGDEEALKVLTPHVPLCASVSRVMRETACIRTVRVVSHALLTQPPTNAHLHLLLARCSCSWRPRHLRE